MPVAAVIDETPKLPMRKLQLEQRQGCVGERARFDQLADSGLRSGALRTDKQINLSDKLAQGLTRAHPVAAKTLLQGDQKLAVWVERHTATRQCR